VFFILTFSFLVHICLFKVVYSSYEALYSIVTNLPQVTYKNKNSIEIKIVEHVFKITVMGLWTLSIFWKVDTLLLIIGKAILLSFTFCLKFAISFQIGFCRNKLPWIVLDKIIAHKTVSLFDLGLSRQSYPFALLRLYDILKATLFL